MTTRRALAAAGVALLSLLLVSTLVPVGTAGAAEGATTAATSDPHTCINHLGSYAGEEISALDVSFDTSGSTMATTGGKVSLTTAEVSVEIPAEQLLALYRGRERSNYSLLARGENTLPAYVWVAIEGENTVEGTQTVHVETTYSTTVTDGTPFVLGFTDVSEADEHYGSIAWLSDLGYATGYDDGTFKPATGVSRQAAAAFLYRIAGSPAGPFPDPGFADVPADHPFLTEISWLAAQDIAEGYGDGTFGGTNPVSRQAMAAFLYRSQGSPTGPFPDPGFNDVPADHPFSTEIAWLAAEGITAGYGDGGFHPGDVVSRQAMAAFLHRLVDPDLDVTQYTNWTGRNSGDESATPGVVTITLPTTTWTPTGDGPVAFREGAPGTISYPVDPAPPVGEEGSGAIAQPEGTIRIDGTSTHNNNTNPYWVKPFGSTFFRIDTTNNPERRQSGGNLNGYGANLDCVAGTIAVADDTVRRNAHGAFDPADFTAEGSELIGWVTKVVDGVEVTGPEPMVNGGSLGRYTIAEGTRSVFATPTTLPPGDHACINYLGSYAPFGLELTELDIELDAPDPAAGSTVTLADATVSVEVPAEYFLALYRGRERGNYSLLARGANSLPAYVWVAIEGENTVEGTQTVHAEATYSTTVTDPTPSSDPSATATNWDGRNSGDESATTATVVVDLPDTTWTHDGSGTISFREGAPGTISYPVDPAPPVGEEGSGAIAQPEGTIRIDGISTHNNNTNPYWVKPFGSVFVRIDTINNPERPENGANENGYGANLDCLVGDLEVANDAIRRNAHGAFDPADFEADGSELIGWVTKVVDGVEVTGPDPMVNGGSLGRYGIDPGARAAFATTVSPL